MSLRCTFIDHGTGGAPDCLRLAEREMAAPAGRQVLIEVAYAGVNRPDVLQRSGSYPPPPGASPYLGLEVAGTIVAVGPDATRWQVGDRVCALTPGGGYAQYCLADERHCLPVPRGLDLLSAAAIPENYFTVWTNVFERARLAAGEKFLVHGGSSGIGLTAIQLARAFGAEVWTTVGNQEKAEACLKAGAQHALIYRDTDFEADIRQATGGQGVDVILDMVGGAYINKNLRLLAVNGRLVQIAFLEGSKAEIDALPIMTKRLSFTGSTLRPRSDEDKGAIAQALADKVLPLMEQGRCLPLIHQVFPLEEAAQAHALMESSRHIGKIMLKVRA
ncbi:NAD(P)H-quinone oxidoreductase [Achromobacter ruhlandii]|uniref:Phthiocerol synthesis polyketide synthase type I PpsC n=1 Tax=Achromobacter ruhlandii TaxID=72557 RepID=A0A2M9GYF2_9BURK|nr:MULTISPECIES: NAD(P)H-quinone oxidoreductase [Achromobacter]MBQ2645982.1 NAD(P)H-quinone oxidoreductase [Achromobacter sp.]OCZ61329.1 NAD(P)H-quinone oxidoreductase [Achromobacter xylosoxidans]PJM69616.1 NAD(P)H-quinone oxidoreductase [Achromobacter ruhlandii]CAB3907732.1 Phthiocerol synthesis polyketide synthase type I PpsC [Achromobacter ruhlandii]CUJ50554.1 Beta-ketoacyl-acyl-carrier-protein synthase I [Achromobacter dolens]